ncbi:MAG: ABC transporter ATP-binding protein [Proteobacteria bacterium]|nr:ABC transporter ATP-binding protein [Pseudomonadota bacterium]MBU1386760.1 ABC transporter ATP-binding protein [Pseudomonadota bacterium]MBU1544704.1 ABC transporter ATP-binding protein [Pseudomonadota bacterium]MBU2430110.1 ABC transporter ATP-binding protein [Pseudomonadota bacterium]MBU2481877.1 ABC transporter ATP-binding protein [Pseudomonadota bacterium]
MLKVKQLNAYYGNSHILQGVDLNIEKGEIVSLLGRNGVGRSTTCMTIMGLVPPKGSIIYNGEEIAGLKPHEIAHRGIGFVPEDRWIFPGLTVMQNLILGQKSRKQKSRWTLDDVFTLFPRLEERSNVHGGLISGGEKQMLTICRTLMGDPDFIMIDEPTEGLAPRVVEQMGQLIETIAARGVSVLLVEQKLSIALKISRRLYIMGQGRIVFSGTPDDLKHDREIRKEWLEV